MTIVVGAISKPKGKRKPFFIIGSDTRSLDSFDGIKLMCRDDQQKIYPFNTMYLGLAGAIPHELFYDLPSVIKDLEMDFHQASEWLKREVKSYLDNYDFIESLGYWRIRIILIAIEENFPKMAILEYDTRYMTDFSCEVNIVKHTGHYLSFIGDTSQTLEHQLKLDKQFKHVKNVGEAKKLIEIFMRHTAEVYPKKVNTRFEFEYGVGDIT